MMETTKKDKIATKKTLPEIWTEIITTESPQKDKK